MKEAMNPQPETAENPIPNPTQRTAVECFSEVYRLAL